MITLSEAFRLCKISDAEGVHLKAADDIRNEEHYFWSKRLIELVDMKKIKVVCIYPKFYFDGSFGGMAFTLRGVTSKELKDLSYIAMRKRGE